MAIIPPPILEQPVDTNLVRDFWTGDWPEEQRKFGQGLLPPSKPEKAGGASSSLPAAAVVTRQRRRMSGRRARSEVILLYS